jgi:hypothetical protein
MRADDNEAPLMAGQDRMQVEEVALEGAAR